jgi:endonuclease YncB( thermonuclease family)
MLASTITSRFRDMRIAAIALSGILSAIVPAAPAHAAGCSFAPQGDGRVAEIIDGRSFRLTDGREIRLAGIEPAPSEPAQSGPLSSDPDAANPAAALTAILAGRDVTLHGEDDTPDRYGRQTAFVFLADSETPVQSLLLAAGAALVSTEVADRECEAVLMSAEAEARQTKKGIWNRSTAIKNAEISDDILAGVGRFAVVEGKVLSVRQSGTTTYLNFGRNWTRDFAVTIPRRALPAIEAGGVALKSLENRQIRVRGFVEARTGPRIELLRAGQIEVLSGIEPSKIRRE